MPNIKFYTSGTLVAKGVFSKPLKQRNALENDQIQTVNFPHIIRKTIDYVSSNIADEITLEDMAVHCRVNKYTYIRIFKNHTGVTPIKWLWDFRTHVSASLIKNHPYLSLTDIAFACGLKAQLISLDLLKLFSVSHLGRIRDLLDKGLKRKDLKIARICSRLLTVLSVG